MFSLFSSPADSKQNKPFYLSRKSSVSKTPEKAMREDWLVLIVDDEPSMHQVTTLALADLEVDGRPIRLINATSSDAAKKLVESHPGIAVALIDVVMETKHAGLDLVEWMRSHYSEPTRIVLRTGQPGAAPAADVAKNYAINGYLEKAQLSAERLRAQLIIELRAYQNALSHK